MRWHMNILTIFLIFILQDNFLYGQNTYMLNQDFFSSDSNITSAETREPIFKKFYKPDLLTLIAGIVFASDYYNYQYHKNDYQKAQEEYFNMKEEDVSKYEKIHSRIDNDIAKINKLAQRIKIDQVIFAGTLAFSFAYRIYKYIHHKHSNRNFSHATISPIIQYNQPGQTHFGISIIINY